MTSTLHTIDEYIQQGPGGIQRVELELAACRDEPADLFFTPLPEEEHLAKQVCQKCEVRWECLSYALATHQRHGIWGGLNADERRLLTRRIRDDMSV